MRELIREYQSILITAVAVCFVFVCLYYALPAISSSSGSLKNDGFNLQVIKHSNADSDINVSYPLGSRICILKDSVFNISDYVVLLNKENKIINDYKYKIYINGKLKNELDTGKCGGYHLVLEISYGNKQIQGDLFVIIEERI